jgi:predicted P-loop ATPase
VCGEVDGKRDRIWATAKAKFEAGEKWELTRLEQALSEKNNENFTDTDPWLETISRFIKDRNEVSVNEILEKLEIEKGKQTRADSKRVRDSLIILGWEQDKNATNRAGERTRRYRPALTQSTQTSDTVDKPVCQECVGNVSPEIPTEQRLQPLNTFDTVKKEDFSPPYVNEKVGGESIPRFWLAII